MTPMCGVTVLFPNPLKGQPDIVPCSAIAVAIVEETGPVPAGVPPARLEVCARHRDKYLQCDDTLVVALAITEVGP